MNTLINSLAERCHADWKVLFHASQQESLREIVRTAFVDTAACIMAGRSEKVARIVADWASNSRGGSGEASIFFGTKRVATSAAAFVNAVAGHALDFDDVGLGGHPSVVLVPVLWAEHERTGVCGFDLVQAYAKGYAVWGELQRRQKVFMHERGWHPTAVFGTVAAAVATCSLRSLAMSDFVHAMGIAASCASGVIANFGSSTKPLQVGRASEAGILAADWAGLGIDASVDALDGRAGLLAALVGRENVNLSQENLDDLPFTLLKQRPGTKKYPVCYASHRVVDGAIALADQHRFSIEDIERIDVTISKTAAGVLRHHRPGTLVEARFSLEFAVSAALIYGRLGIAEVSEIVLDRAELRALMERVAIKTVETSCPIEPSFAYTDNIVITLKSGDILDSGPIRFARGHAELPLTDQDVRAKFMACAPDGGVAGARELLERINAVVARRP